MEGQKINKTHYLKATDKNKAGKRARKCWGRSYNFRWMVREGLVRQSYFTKDRQKLRIFPGEEHQIQRPRDRSLSIFQKKQRGASMVGTG